MGVGKVVSHYCFFVDTRAEALVGSCFQLLPLLMGAAPIHLSILQECLYEAVCYRYWVKDKQGLSLHRAYRIHPSSSGASVAPWGPESQMLM